MNDCMIDLETLGSRFDAPIASIGAVHFNIETGAIGPTFYRQLDLEDSFRFGRAGGSTVAWWLKQGDAARNDVANGQTLLMDALRDLADFVPKGSRVPAEARDHRNP